MKKLLLFITALIFATTSAWTQSSIVFPGNTLSGSFGAWGGTGYFYSPTFNVNATGGIDITYYDIDVSQFTEGNIWLLKGVALPGVSASNSMTSIDPNNNSIWCNILNMQVASGVDWDGHPVSTLGPDGIVRTNDDTRHQGTQDWYRQISGGKIDGPAAGPYYNNESYVTPNPRHPAAPVKTASELNSYDFRLRILPTGPNAYTYEMWFRMHNSAATVEGAGWVFNKAMNNSTPAAAWRAFTANSNGTGSTVFPISGIDLSSVYIFMGLGNFQDPASHTLTWGKIEVTGTPFTPPSVVWVNPAYFAGGANDGHVWGYDAFITIQGGINAVAVGGTVNVAVGTYSEKVTINKQVFLQGNVGSIIDGTGLGGNGFLIQASNVRIKNFEIKNYQIGIRTFGGPGNFGTLQIQKCNIHNNTQNGILIVNDIFTSVMIKSTQIYSNGQNGIGISNGASITSLSIVESNTSNNGQHGMFIANANLTNILIENSNFNNATSYGSCGITFSTTASTVGSFTMTGGSLSGNTGGGLYVAQAPTTFGSFILDGVIIQNNHESGILLGGGGSAGNLSVENCTFQGNAWEDFDLSGGWFGGFSVPNTTTISGNFFNEGAWAKIYIGSAGVFGNIINVNQNSFVPGAWRIYNLNTRTVNAICNWWGSVSPGVNTVTANVIKVPWLTNGTDNSTDPGFQPSVGCSAPCDVVLTATVTQPLCFGQTGSVVLSATGGTGAYTFGGDATTNLAPGTYNYAVTDANGCSATASAIINAAPSLLVLTATPTQPLCYGQTGSVVLSATGGMGSYTFGGDATTNLAPGTYNYTVTDANGCSANASEIINAGSPNPTCSITAIPGSGAYTGDDPNKIYLGYGPQTVTLSSAVSGGSGPTYLWSPAAGLSCTNCASPVFTPTSEGNYTFTLTVTTSNGCSTTCSIIICVLDIRVPGNGNKVYLCHVPQGNPNNPQTLSVSINAVPAHVPGHLLDHLGKCDQSCDSLQYKAGEVGELIVTEGIAFETAIYPNPFTNEITLTIESESSDPASVTIYDLTGKIVGRMEAITPNASVTFGSELNTGMYFVFIRQGEQVQKVKIVKTK